MENQEELVSGPFKFTVISKDNGEYEVLVDNTGSEVIRYDLNYIDNGVNQSTRVTCGPAQ